MFHGFHFSKSFVSFYTFLLLTSLVIYKSYASNNILSYPHIIDIKDFNNIHGNYRITENGRNGVILKNTDTCQYDNTDVFEQCLQECDQFKGILSTENNLNKSKNLLACGPEFGKLIRNTVRLAKRVVRKDRKVRCDERSACEIPGCDIDNLCRDGDDGDIDSDFSESDILSRSEDEDCELKIRKMKEEREKEEMEERKRREEEQKRLLEKCKEEQRRKKEEKERAERERKEFEEKEKECNEKLRKAQECAEKIKRQKECAEKLRKEKKRLDYERQKLEMEEKQQREIAEKQKREINEKFKQECAERRKKFDEDSRVLQARLEKLKEECQKLGYQTDKKGGDSLDDCIRECEEKTRK